MNEPVLAGKINNAVCAGKMNDAVCAGKMNDAVCVVLQQNFILQSRANMGRFLILLTTILRHSHGNQRWYYLLFVLVYCAKLSNMTG